MGPPGRWIARRWSQPRAATWQAATLLGALAGGTVPSEVPLCFAVPLAFLALAVPSITDRPTDRPSLAAAVASGTLAVGAGPLGAAAFPAAALGGILAGSALALRGGST